MGGMVRQEILPAVSSYIASLAEAVGAKRAILAGLPCVAETALIEKLSALLDKAYGQVEELLLMVEDPKTQSQNILTAATHYRDEVIPAMNRLRATIDEMEQNVSSKYWPYPSYADLMYST